MSIVKSSKLWSTLALLASLCCLGAMIYCVLGVRLEHFSFRDASGHLRTVAQVSVFVLGFATLVGLFSLKNIRSLFKSIIAIAILVTPLLVLKANMPAGTPLFTGAQAGGMAAPNAMGAGGMAGGGAPQDPSTAPTNDISTDTVNPPLFSAVIPLREGASNAVEYVPTQAAAQAAQFPDIKSITSSMTNDAAFQRALEVADGMGWEIVAQDVDSGIIEAVASTFFFRFKDDVVIRVSANGSSSIVDIRSHSRVGRGDRGKNAERVRAFIADF
ncbi:MAG: DUF1499 domain-containing protein [Acidiferrobacterales bacterium]|nr:DUF1499 domain-containing protein [Acidiferrobacterales bacterium]